MPTQSKPKTKKAQLIQMLTRKAGADVATISEKLGWLPHTTRAALTGLRKAGFEITAEKPGRWQAVVLPHHGPAGGRHLMADRRHCRTLGGRSVRWTGPPCAWPGRRRLATPRHTSCR